MNLKAEVDQILQKRKALHDEDPAVYVYWEKLADVLGRDEEATIKFLNSANADEVDWISEVFEEIALKLNSPQFVATLEKLQIKFPGLDLQWQIVVAKRCTDSG